MIARRIVIHLCLLAGACQADASTPTVAAPTSTLPPETPVPSPRGIDVVIPVPTIPASSVGLEGAELPPGFSLIKLADLYPAFVFDPAGNSFFEAHASADGLDFYHGDALPAEYRGNAFV